jgi:ribosomal protein S18 acetylase RimI-like enzyme
MRPKQSKSFNLRAQPGKKRDQVVVRQARFTDAAELLRLVRAYYRFDGIRFESKSVDAALRKLLRNQSLGRVWIMRDAGKAIGYIVLTFNYDLEFGGLEGIVTDLFVCSAYRGQGLGSRALALVDAHCGSAGIRTIELQVEQHNKSAQEFYRKIGFTSLPRIVMSRDVGKSVSPPVNWI